MYCEKTGSTTASNVNLAEKVIMGLMKPYLNKCYYVDA